MNYKKILLNAGLYLLIFLLGCGTGGLFVKGLIKVEKDKILTECWDNARQELVGVCLPAANTNKDTAVTNFYGKILAVDVVQNQITLDPAPLDDGQDEISSLVVKIDSATQIEQVIKKDDAVYQQELADFDSKFVNDKTAVYPLPFFNKKAESSSFAAGQNVTITSKDDARKAQAVTAAKILINYQQ